MFKQAAKATAWPATPAVIAYAKYDGDHYFATDAGGANGALHPAWVLAAWCLEEGLPVEIVVNAQVPPAWVTAFHGLTHLGGSAQGVRHKLRPWKPGPAVLPDAEQGLWQVEVDGAAPPTGQVLTAGDLFTPNASGFFNLQRLYAMAALLMEHQSKAAVAAIITNASGFIVATGFKSYGDSGCGHAEVKAILSIRGELPATGAIFTTLKPCTMCAGLLQATSGANFRKYWARDDPSKGADWGEVDGLAVPASMGLSMTTQTARNVRGIKLGGNKNFSDEFGTAWSHRGDAHTQKSARLAEAFTAWRDKNIVAGRVLVTNQVRVVADKEGPTVASRLPNIGSIDALSKRVDLFERYQSGTWKKGVDGAASQAIIKAFTNASKAIGKAAEEGAKAQDMGIIKFISEHAKSASLSTASHRALGAKFAKYGKTTAEIAEATDIHGAVATSAKPPNPTVKQVVDYLYGFLQSRPADTT